MVALLLYSSGLSDRNTQTGPFSCLSSQCLKCITFPCCFWLVCFRGMERYAKMWPADCTKQWPTIARISLQPGKEVSEPGSSGAQKVWGQSGLVATGSIEGCVPLGWPDSGHASIRVLSPSLPSSLPPLLQYAWLHNVQNHLPW